MSLLVIQDVELIHTRLMLIAVKLNKSLAGNSGDLSMCFTSYTFASVHYCHKNARPLHWLHWWFQKNHFRRLADGSLSSARDEISILSCQFFTFFSPLAYFYIRHVINSHLCWVTTVPPRLEERRMIVNRKWRTSCSHECSRCFLSSNRTQYLLSSQWDELKI